MRVATFVLGLALVVIGKTSEAFDTATDSANSVQSAAVLAAPTERFITRSSGSLDAQMSRGRHGAAGAMSFVPAQDPTTFARPRAPLMSAANDNPRRRYNPASIPLPVIRTLEDHLLTGFVALMLIAYQLRRKHRFLRPHQFSA